MDYLPLGLQFVTVVVLDEAGPPLLDGGVLRLGLGAAVLGVGGEDGPLVGRDRQVEVVPSGGSLGWRGSRSGTLQCVPVSVYLCMR